MARTKQIARKSEHPGQGPAQAASRNAMRNGRALAQHRFVNAAFVSSVRMVCTTHNRLSRDVQI
jgi:hypothetical protein